MTGSVSGKASSDVLLREVEEGDVPIFYEQQLDPAANHMAAFTSEDPTDRQAHAAHWTKILRDDGVTKRTIVLGDDVVGYVVKFERFGDPEVSYWIDRTHWGKGIATGALRKFLDVVEARPLYARVVKDNAASLRVLEKCGFAICREDKGFANARGEEVEEFVLVLEPGAD